MERLAVSRPKALKTYLGLVSELPRLDLGAAEALEARARGGDVPALRRLTEGFLGLVVAEANVWRGKGLRFEALIAAGNRGLSAALRRGGADPLEERVRRQVRRRLRLAVALAARRAV